MKVAAIQMVSSAVLKDNLQQAHQLLQQAAGQGAELAVLPEYFCLIGPQDSDKLAIQEPFGSGPIQQFLADSARELGLWLVGGTLPLSGAGEGRVFNSSLAFNPHGDCVARYDKIHLFRYDNGRESYDESRVLDRGHTPTRFALPSKDGHIWQIGMSVCYDLRFAELYRGYAARAWTCCWCRPPLPTPPDGRTGRCCCVPARLKTWPLYVPQRRAACTPMAARPGASRW